jgi:amine acid ABC transporter, permease protein, 3-TM region, His/Glu/Gln/Arg/opine family
MNGTSTMSIFKMIGYISSGIGITFELVPLCILSTVIIGAILGIIQFKRVPFLSRIIDLYILAMRGVPPLVVLMLLFYSINFKSPFMAAFIALTVYHSAYVTEIVRGGFEAIPKGQMKAGESLGLSYPVIMLKIYIPQIVLQIIPSLCGQYILLVKDTTLVSIVGVQDIMWNARQLMEITFNPLVVYLLIGVFFYLLCLVTELIAVKVERSSSRNIKMKFQGV